MPSMMTTRESGTRTSRYPTRALALKSYIGA